MKEQENQEIKNLFVTYEIALKLKEKGFDIPCISSYSDKDTFNFTTGGLMYKTIPEPKDSCIAPLYQQVIDFVNSKGFSLQYGNISLSLLDKQILECLDKLESTK